jgi:hypothetical protein
MTQVIHLLFHDIFMTNASCVPLSLKLLDNFDEVLSKDIQKEIAHLLVEM